MLCDVLEVLDWLGDCDDDTDVVEDTLILGLPVPLAVPDTLRDWVLL